MGQRTGAVLVGGGTGEGAVHIPRGAIALRTLNRGAVGFTFTIDNDIEQAVIKSEHKNTRARTQYVVMLFFPLISNRYGMGSQGNIDPE